MQEEKKSYNSKGTCGSCKYFITSDGLTGECSCTTNAISQYHRKRKNTSSACQKKELSKEIIFRKPDYSMIFTIPFEQPFSEWTNVIKQNLNEMHIDNSKELSKWIFESVRDNVEVILSKYGYSSFDFKYSRKTIKGELNCLGLDFVIKCNRILWIYLEHFSDLRDYTKCFDIGMEVIDKDILDERVIYVPYKTLVYAVASNEDDTADIRDIREAIYYLNKKGKII